MRGSGCAAAGLQVAHCYAEGSKQRRIATLRAAAARVAPVGRIKAGHSQRFVGTPDAARCAGTRLGAHGAPAGCPVFAACMVRYESSGLGWAIEPVANPRRERRQAACMHGHCGRSARGAPTLLTRCPASMTSQKPGSAGSAPRTAWFERNSEAFCVARLSQTSARGGRGWDKSRAAAPLGSRLAAPAHCLGRRWRGHCSQASVQLPTLPRRRL